MNAKDVLAQFIRRHATHTRPQQEPFNPKQVPVQNMKAFEDFMDENSRRLEDEHNARMAVWQYMQSEQALDDIIDEGSPAPPWEE